MFEFYFQSGEFASEANGLWDFLKDLSIQVLGALVAAYAAVRLYYRQRNEQLANIAKEKRDRDFDNVVFFQYLVENALDCVHSQIPMYEKFAADIQGSVLGIPEIQILRTTTALDRLVNKTDHKDLFHSFREVNRHENFDSNPRSFQLGTAMLEFLLGKIENDLENVIRTYQDCSTVTKGIADAVKTIFTESAVHHAALPKDELGQRIEELKAKLNGVQSEDTAVHKKATRSFIDETLAMISTSDSSTFSPSLWKIARVAAEAKTAYTELDLRQDAMYRLATENQKIFAEDLERLESLFTPLRQFVGVSSKR